MDKLKQLVKSFWANDNVRRVAHTVWQVVAASLVTGLVAAHSSADVKLAITAALAAGLSALKNALVARS